MWMHLSVGAGMMAVFIGVRFGGWSWANINIDLLDPKPWDSFINFFNLTK